MLFFFSNNKRLSRKYIIGETVKRAEKRRLKERQDRDLQLFEELLYGKGDKSGL